MWLDRPKASIYKTSVNVARERNSLAAVVSITAMRPQY
jgi:hypothetical protein